MVQVTDCLTKMLAASDEERKAHPTVEDLVREMTNAVALAAYANHELDNERVYGVTSGILALCSPSNPVTTRLFGDEWSKQVKDMTAVNKVGQRVEQNRFHEKTSSFSYK